MKHAWELVGEVVVGANTTQVDFTGLNFTKDDVLKLECDIIGAASASYYLLINGVDTLASYYRQYIGATSTTVVGSRQNNSELTVCDSGFKTRTSAIIRQSESGHVNALAKSVRHLGSTDTRIYDTAISMTAAQSGIQQIGVKVLTANAIGAGSVFRLYKLKAKKLADIVVGANTTQVDVTGLNLTAENELLLVSDIADVGASNASPDLRVNDEVSTNHYRQSVYVTGTSTGATRTNDATYMATTKSRMSMALTKIKVLGDGRVVSQTENIRDYTAITPALWRTAVITVNAVGTLTKLSIVGDEANGIGVGSRFTLYQLK